MTDLSRRSFAESLALAALAPLLDVPPESIRLPSWEGTVPESIADHPAALAKALREAIRVQYGARLSTQDLSAITHQIQTGLDRVSQLKKIHLTNGDEPDFVFSPVRFTS